MTLKTASPTLTQAVDRDGLHASKLASNTLDGPLWNHRATNNVSCAITCAAFMYMLERNCPDAMPYPLEACHVRLRGSLRASTHYFHHGWIRSFCPYLTVPHVLVSQAGSTVILLLYGLLCRNRHYSHAYTSPVRRVHI